MCISTPNSKPFKIIAKACLWSHASQSALSYESGNKIERSIKLKFGAQRQTSNLRKSFLGNEYGALSQVIILLWIKKGEGLLRVTHRDEARVNASNEAREQRRLPGRVSPGASEI